MTGFWSSWVTLLSIGCWVFVAGALYFTLTKWKPELDEDGTTGHEYDGLKEYDKPIPKWWLAIFVLTLGWGLLYWALYPSVQPGVWKGVASVEVAGEQVNWSSKNELAQDLERNNAVFQENFSTKLLEDPKALAELANLKQLQDRFESPDAIPDELNAQIDESVNKLQPAVLELSSSPRALKVGQKLFLQNCAVCHGSGAKGATGYPNLTDTDWLYGGEPHDIVLTLLNGRQGQMPAWRDQLGEQGVAAAAEYVYSLTHTDGVDNTLATQGQAIFETNCAVCHGNNAKGSHAVGAPNLTDDIWLYGGDRESLKDTLRYGRAGVMPAWQDKLGNERIMLLASYVYSLSQNEALADEASTN